MTDADTSDVFPRTPWSAVVAAGSPTAPGNRAALEALFRAYWYPVYAYARRKGHPPEDAEDLVQGLFADLLARNDFGDLCPTRGRFRAFLVACFNHFAAKERDARLAVKRGGRVTVVSIDRLLAEARYEGEPADPVTPERVFERRWALTVLDRAVGRLDAEGRAGDRGPLYDAVRPAVLGQPDAPAYKEVAAALGLTESAVKSAAHRYRNRYRDFLRDVVAGTLLDPADVDDEIRDLIAAVSG